MEKVMDEYEAARLGIIDEFNTWQDAGMTESSFSAVRFIPKDSEYYENARTHLPCGFWSNNQLWTE